VKVGREEGKEGKREKLFESCTKRKHLFSPMGYRKNKEKSLII
jgi:hypothetical protein